MQQMTVIELNQAINNGEQLQLLDVRENWEFSFCQIENSQHIPLSDLLQYQSFEKLDSSKELVVICHHGIRSQQAAYLLQENGFNKIINLQGGIHKWAQQIEPSMPCY